MIENKIKELENKIKKYSKKYYEGESLISDEYFDTLITELKRINPDSDIFKKPGWGYMPDPGEKKVHHFGMKVGSLEKIRFKDVDKYTPILLNENSLTDKDLFIITPKLDGNSLVCYYHHGILNKIVSRGDGYIGIDVTKNFINNKSIPRKIKNYNNKWIGIRGEGILTYEDFEEMEGSNPRNKCAGLIQSKNADENELKKIKFIPYQITAISSILTDLKWKTKIDHFQYFSENGFLQIPFEIMQWNDLYEIHLNKQTINENLTIINNQHCPVDGIVINKNYQNYMHFKKNNVDGYAIYVDGIAFKYPDKTKETIVKNINWNLTMNGKYVPILKIQKTIIDGISIENVTANNYKWLHEMHCGIGAKIKIRRANECIPNITKTIIPSDNFNTPKQCFSCNQLLSLDEYETHLICQNINCPAKDIALIYKIWNFIKPDGASDACFNLLLNKIRKTKIIYTMYSDIITQCNFYLKNNELWDTNPENHYHKLIKQSLINFKNKKASIPEIIKMANIPGIGLTIGERIENNLNYSVKNFINYCKTEFPNNIFKYELLNKYKTNLQKITYIWEPNIISNKIDNIIRVAVTGNLSQPRNKWFKEMEQFGVKKSGVTKDCDCLICNNPSNSSSYKKAVNYKIPILTEKEFYQKYNINK